MPGLVYFSLYGTVSAKRSRLTPGGNPKLLDLFTGVALEGYRNLGPAFVEVCSKGEPYCTRMGLCREKRGARKERKTGCEGQKDVPGFWAGLPNPFDR